MRRVTAVKIPTPLKHYSLLTQRVLYNIYYSEMKESIPFNETYTPINCYRHVHLYLNHLSYNYFALVRYFFIHYAL